MGCQTGFYAITSNMEQDELLHALENGLTDILNATEVPAANERQPHHQDSCEHGRLPSVADRVGDGVAGGRLKQADGYRGRSGDTSHPH